MTWLPVAVNHYRTVSGNHENWHYVTYAPNSLLDDERLDALILDDEADMCWLRTDQGVLHMLPERQGAGYGFGYGDGGPGELAAWIQKIVRSDGYNLAAGTSSETPNQKLLRWVSSAAAKRTQELTLVQLARLSRTGVID